MSSYNINSTAVAGVGGKTFVYTCIVKLLIPCCVSHQYYIKRSMLITVIIVYLEWIVELGVCVNDAVS